MDAERDYKREANEYDGVIRTHENSDAEQITNNHLAMHRKHEVSGFTDEREYSTHSRHRINASQRRKELNPEIRERRQTPQDPRSLKISFALKSMAFLARSMSNLESSIRACHPKYKNEGHVYSYYDFLTQILLLFKIESIRWYLSLNLSQGSG